MTHSHSRRQQALGITSALALVLAGAASASATTDPDGSAVDDAVAAAPAPTPDPAQPRTAPETFEDGGYIVLLAEQPVASYDGGTPGFAPTKPGKGKPAASSPDSTPSNQAAADALPDAVLETATPWRHFLRNPRLPRPRPSRSPWSGPARRA